MDTSIPHSEYLVLSRGKWDPSAPKEEIETAIDQFYTWLMANIDQGRMKMGSRLGTEGACVSKSEITTDGPFGEAKEVIGGYWFILAPTLAEAAALAAENPCIPYGLSFEIRPLESAPSSAYHLTNETPI